MEPGAIAQSVTTAVILSAIGFAMWKRFERLEKTLDEHVKESKPVIERTVRHDEQIKAIRIHMGWPVDP